MLEVSRDGRDRDDPPRQQQLLPGDSSSEVGIRTDWLTGEDLFVISDQIDAERPSYFKVFVKPLVNLSGSPGSSSCSARWSRCGPTRASSGALVERRLALAQVMTGALVLGRAARGRLRSSRRAPVPARAGAVRRPARRAGRARAAAACARRGARPGARGAQGARVRPPHGPDRRRRLPRARRPAAAAAAEALGLWTPVAAESSHRPEPRLERGHVPTGRPPTSAGPSCTTGLRRRSTAWIGRACFPARRPARAALRALGGGGSRSATTRRPEARRRPQIETLSRPSPQHRQRRRRCASEIAGVTTRIRGLEARRRRRLAPALDARAGPRAPRRSASAS